MAKHTDKSSKRGKLVWSEAGPDDPIYQEGCTAFFPWRPPAFSPSTSGSPKNTGSATPDAPSTPPDSAKE
jgi:hypothetical protein